MAKILVVDDEQDILELIRHSLNKEGFEVHIAMNGQQAIEKAKQIIPDLILMDVMMPIMDGMEACRQLKEDPTTKNISIVFLTARSEEFAELAGFEAGADDYVAKPIRSRVLLSRIKALLRRQNGSSPREESQKIEFGNLVIDREKFVIQYNGKSLQFPRKEFELLSFLASKPGRVFSRDEILENVWGNEVLVVDRTIDVHVRKIREKLDDKFIYTVKGVGYKFEL
jgi:two-component system alkaline phosphatase synthesis response regulator PhoP